MKYVATVTYNVEILEIVELDAKNPDKAAEKAREMVNWKRSHQVGRGRLLTRISVQNVSPGELALD